MRLLLVIFSLFIMLVSFASEAELRDYDEIQIPAGPFLQVISLQEFSTAYCEEGDTLEFVTTSDIYMFDKNVIPEGTRLIGYLEEKHEPIKGTNASMKIFINKMKLKDGNIIPIKSYIYTSNNNIIGGELTKPAKYINMPHYQRWTMFRTYGVLQCVPGAERRMGEHVTVSSGANLIVVLAAPINFTHSQLVY